MLLLLHPAPRASLHPARPALPPLGRLPLLRRRRRRPSHPAPAPGPDCRAPAIGFSPRLSGAGHRSPARPALPPPRRRLPPLRRRHRHLARPAPAPGPDCLAPAIGFSPRLSSAGLRSPARLALPPPPPPLPCVCPAPRLRGLQERHLLPQERPRQPCPRSQRPRRRLSTPSQPCCFRSSPLRPFRCGSAAVPSGVMVCVWSNQFWSFFSRHTGKPPKLAGIRGARQKYGSNSTYFRGTPLFVAYYRDQISRIYATSTAALVQNLAVFALEKIK